MTSKSEKFLDLAGEHHADIDHMAMEREEQFANRFEELMANPAERNEQIFEDLQIPIDISFYSLLDIPLYNRDMNWMNAFMLITAACKQQAFVEIFGVEFIELAEHHAQRTRAQADTMTVAELKEASSKRDMKSRVAKAREAKYGNA